MVLRAIGSRPSTPPSALRQLEVVSAATLAAGGYDLRASRYRIISNRCTWCRPEQMLAI